jgi:hypothetical protein
MATKFVLLALVAAAAAASVSAGMQNIGRRASAANRGFPANAQ